MLTTDQPGEARQVTLDRRLDAGAAVTLRQVLLDHGGRPLTLDAGAVTHLGGLCLQVLIAAGTAWRQAGMTLTIGPRSAEFDAALSTFAVPLSSLESRGLA